MRVIDISRAISDEMAIWPGDPPVGVEPHLTIAHDGASVSRLTLGTHTGTHVDPPAHFLTSSADAAVVCVNDRVGVVAAVDLTWLGTGPDAGGQHWLGDETAALHWGRDNISDYGGAPNLDRLIGRATGLVSIDALCAAPL